MKRGRVVSFDQVVICVSSRRPNMYIHRPYEDGLETKFDLTAGDMLNYVQEDDLFDVTLAGKLTIRAPWSEIAVADLVQFQHDHRCLVLVYRTYR